MYRKKLLRKGYKEREIEIVTRKEYPEIETKVRRLKKQDYPLTPVSSSFISEIGYETTGRIITIMMLAGKGYEYSNVPFKIWEGFYYAHSKGTYYNYYIKGKYDSRRII